MTIDQFKMTLNNNQINRQNKRLEISTQKD